MFIKLGSQHTESIHWEEEEFQCTFYNDNFLGEHTYQEGMFKVNNKNKTLDNCPPGRFLPYEGKKYQEVFA